MVTVVVIEDDPEILDNIIDTLEAEGLKVSGADSGRRGLEVVQEMLPDLVICDVTMPEFSGFDVLVELRVNEQTAVIPFVFLTARSDRDNMRKGMELGADDYVSKPFTSAELVAAVNAQLQKRKTIEQKYESTLKVLRSNIIYALPHELRTPLMQILGYSQILRDDAQTVIPETIQEMSDWIYRAGLRLADIIENYLVYAQLEIMQGNDEQIKALGKHILPNPTEIITQTALACAERYSRVTDLELKILDNAAIRISNENMTKLIDELVDNAFKFSKSGQQVTIESGSTVGNYQIRIIDHGRGMTIDQIKSLGGAYMQFGRALHEQQGLGLGFAIARKIVEFHKGHIEVASEPNEATIVTLNLPAS